MTLKIRSRSPKSNQFFPLYWWCTCASLVIFHPLVKESIYSVVTLNIRSRSPKSNHVFTPFLWCIYASSVKFLPLVKEIVCTQTFYFINKAPLGSFLSIYYVVTLKIRSRSPKSNHFSPPPPPSPPPSCWCICASLVKFQPLVKEIVCTQTFSAFFSA